MFTQQPVSSVDCDVYQEEKVTLKCMVESSSTADLVDTSDINIRWYFNNGTEYELTIGTSQMGSGGNGGQVQVTSTLDISARLPNVSFVSTGFYYCKVEMISASVHQNCSQSFEVFTQEMYLQQGSVCAGRSFHQPLRSCAVHRDVSTTTLPGENICDLIWGNLLHLTLY